MLAPDEGRRSPAAFRLRRRTVFSCIVLALLLWGEVAVAQGRGGRGGGDGDGRGDRVAFGRGGRGGGAGTTALPLTVPLGLAATARLPAENPITPEKVALGRRLFFDPLLSADQTVACATCHQPATAFADTAVVSGGFLGRKGGRNSPTLINRVYGSSFFWDGRARTLEEAVLMPVQDTLEMSMSLPEVIRRLGADEAYRTGFAASFPGEEISETTVARALATYVRTLLAGNSAFDRFRAGDRTALGESAQRGERLFFGRARCAQCHRGFNFTDEDFEALGVPSSDPGRFAATGDAGDRGEFKVPTLRDVALTAPYMHDGSIATLEEVVEFYDRGGGLTQSTGGGRRGRGDVRPLGLSATQKEDLVAFLRALTSETRVQ